MLLPRDRLAQERYEQRQLRRAARLLDERRAQIRGLLLLALVILVFHLLRHDPHRIFPPNGWRLW